MLCFSMNMQQFVFDYKEIIVVVLGLLMEEEPILMKRLGMGQLDQIAT